MFNEYQYFFYRYMMALMSGHTMEKLQGEELERQQRDFKGYDKGLVRLNPGRWLFPVDYTKFADNLYKFKFRTSDVVVMTWPKAGTTWTQEIVWTMRNNPNLDHPLAKMGVNDRSPFMEFDMLLGSKKLTPLEDNASFMDTFRKQCPGKDPKDGLTLQMSEAAPDPRTIKTHLPFSLHTPDLLDTAKVVYVARSPKDVVVSYYHHSRLILCHDFNGSLDQFTQYFFDDDLVFGPYWLHMKEAWEKRDHPNMHFIFYEDVKTNNMVELQKLNKFLNTNLTEEQLSGARGDEEFVNLGETFFNENVLKNDGGFFRKGEVGDGKQRLSPEQQAKIDQWTHQHTKDFGASFRYTC
ncbi:Luciferin sulfotransferase-like 2 [Homarus americanus]|uniref:Luciferin sulfotransferase-like 2 n=1 Tax=Homarus americanus TaxID=6706 RepID=A0A8J5MP53_HOMAM|nr:Luciferin sulfotransferase-like 2 [Homarus americanus]